MTIYKLRPTKKIIVRSPQLSDVGKLTEWDKICKNKKNKCKRQGSDLAIKSFSLRDPFGRLSRSAIGRLWEEGCPCWADHQHGGYWWLPYHPTPYERLSAPPTPSCLPSLLRRWALGGFAWLEYGSRMVSDWDLLKENLQGPPRPARQQTNLLRSPTSGPDSQLTPRNSWRPQIFHYTIFLHKPPKPFSGQPIPRLKQYSDLLPQLISSLFCFASLRVPRTFFPPTP